MGNLDLVGKVFWGGKGLAMVRSCPKGQLWFI